MTRKPSGHGGWLPWTSRALIPRPRAPRSGPDATARPWSATSRGSCPVPTQVRPARLPRPRRSRARPPARSACSPCTGTGCRRARRGSRRASGARSRSGARAPRASSLAGRSRTAARRSGRRPPAPDRDRSRPQVGGHQALDRGDAPPAAHPGKRDAGEHGLSVHQDRAGPAIALVAALLRAREPEAVAQDLEQGPVVRSRDLGAVSVYIQGEDAHPLGLSRMSSGRTSLRARTSLPPEGDSRSSIEAAIRKVFAPHLADPRGARLAGAWRKTLRLLRPLGAVSQGNTVRVLTDGDEVFESMWAAIARAERSVVLTTYILEPDRVGERTLLELENAAGRGCRVLLVLDAFGSHRVSGERLARLRARGATVVSFNPIVRWRAPFSRLVRY